jgi:hypothetical protein
MVRYAALTARRWNQKWRCIQSSCVMSHRTPPEPQIDCPPPSERTPWARPVLYRHAASQAELTSGSHPDGLGDQLS